MAWGGKRRLERVRKKFPYQRNPAVQNLIEALEAKIQKGEEVEDNATDA
jgi:ribosomal protein S8E